MAVAELRLPKRSELSKDLLLGLVIHEAQLERKHLDNRDVAKLLMERGLLRREDAKTTVSRAEDMLMDHGLLDIKYVKEGDVNRPVYELCRHGYEFWEAVRTHVTPD